MTVECVTHSHGHWSQTEGRCESLPILELTKCSSDFGTPEQRFVEQTCRLGGSCPNSSSLDLRSNGCQDLEQYSWRVGCKDSSDRPRTLVQFCNVAHRNWPFQTYLFERDFNSVSNFKQGGIVCHHDTHNLSTSPQIGAVGKNMLRGCRMDYESRTMACLEESVHETSSPMSARSWLSPLEDTQSSYKRTMSLRKFDTPLRSCGMTFPANGRT